MFLPPRGPPIERNIPRSAYTSPPTAFVVPPGPPRPFALETPSVIPLHIPSGTITSSAFHPRAIQQQHIPADARRSGPPHPAVQIIRKSPMVLEHGLARTPRRARRTPVQRPVSAPTRGRCRLEATLTHPSYGVLLHPRARAPQPSSSEPGLRGKVSTRWPVRVPADSGVLRNEALRNVRGSARCWGGCAGAGRGEAGGPSPPMGTEIRAGPRLGRRADVDYRESWKIDQAGVACTGLFM